MATRNASGGGNIYFSPSWVAVGDHFYRASHIDEKGEMKLYRVQRPKRVVWRKSSFCTQAECAEVTRKNGMIPLRSSLARRVVVRYTGRVPGTDSWH